MWSRHQLANELFVVLLRGNGMFGKNAFAGGGKSLAAKVAALIAVSIGVSIRGIGTYVSTADCATGGAIVSEGVTDAIQSRAAVLALCGAGIETYVTAVGIFVTADGAGIGASIFISMSEAGSFAADITNVTAVFSGSNVRAGCGSLFAADVAGGIAIAVVGMCNGGGNRQSLAAVTANRTANVNGLMRSSLSVTGGAALDIAGCIASEGVGVSRYGLAAAFNLTDAVAIERIVVVANVIANGKANVTNEVCIFIYVICRLGSTAGIAFLIVAGTGPNVLLGSLVATAVVTDLIASATVSVLVIGSYVVAGTAGAAASEFEIVQIGIHNSRAAAVNAGNGALEFICVLCLASRTAVGALRGAGMKPCMLKTLCRADLFTNVTLNVAGLRIGVNHAVSLCTANGARGGALGSVGVLQIGAGCITNGALGSTVVFVRVSERLKRGLANGADGAVAGFARMLNRGGSFHGLCTAVTERIALGAVLMALGTETTRKRNERQGYG